MRLNVRNVSHFFFYWILNNRLSTSEIVWAQSLQKVWVPLKKQQRFEEPTLLKPAQRSTLEVLKNLYSGQPSEECIVSTVIKFCLVWKEI